MPSARLAQTLFENCAKTVHHVAVGGGGTGAQGMERMTGRDGTDVHVRRERLPAALVGLVDSAGLGVHLLDAEGRVTWANAAQLELLGYAEHEYVGRLAAEIHGGGGGGDDPLGPLRRGEPVHAREVRIRHRDGSARHAMMSATPGPDPASPLAGAYCLFQDVTDCRRVERRLSAENAVARVLAGAATLAEATPRVLEAICRTTAWSWGALWCVDGDDGSLLRCVEFWHRPEVAAPRLGSHVCGLTCRRGDGLPGAVWASGAPAWVADDEQHPGGNHDAGPRGLPGRGDGLDGVVAFPVLGRAGGVLGVLEFFSRHGREPEPELLDMMRAVGRQLGQFIERTAGERDLASSEARNAAVVRASLDCIISIDHRGRVIGWNPAAERTFGYARAEAVGCEMAELIIPRGFRERHRLGLASALVTGAGPMLGRRVETLAVRKDGEEFPVEVTVTGVKGADGAPTFTGYVRDISERRVADQTTARLRAVLQELLVARDIQESVLPRRVPRLPGIEVAGMVRAAAQCSGDFYDYLTLPDGRSVVALGDVSGHGVGPALVAAETAMCLRTLARVYGRVDHLFTEANAILADATPPATFVTMMLLDVDPVTRTLYYANAGHPTGLIIGPDCRVKAELESMDLPLAVSPDVAYERGGPLTLAPGDLVLMVSDGVLEAWSPDGQPFGRHRLREVACGLQPESAATVVERLYDAVRAFTQYAPQHDDISAVALKVDDH